jgi:HEAT repeat protein
VDADGVATLNGSDAWTALQSWRDAGEVALLADAATNAEIDPGARFFAVRYLGRFDDARSVSALIGALADKEANVRAQAARSLRAIGESAGAAVPALTKTLFDGEGNVRISSARALGAIGDPSAKPALLKVVETTAWPALHSWATDALVQLGAEEAEPHLMRHLSDEKAWQRRWAAKRLGEIGSPAALSAIEQARRKDFLHRRAYTNSLRSIRGRSN